MTGWAGLGANAVVSMIMMTGIACSSLEKVAVSNDTDTGDVPETDQPVLGDVDVELEPVTDIIEVGTDSEIIASVTATEYDLSEIEVTWKSSLDGTLGQSAPDTSGRARMSTAVLSPGWHDLTVEVRNPAGRYDEDTEAVGICEWGCRA